MINKVVSRPTPCYRGHYIGDEDPKASKQLPHCGKEVPQQQASRKPTPKTWNSIFGDCKLHTRQPNNLWITTHMAGIIPPFPSFDVKPESGALDTWFKKYIARFRNLVRRHHRPGATKGAPVALCWRGGQWHFRNAARHRAGRRRQRSRLGNHRPNQLLHTKEKPSVARGSPWNASRTMLHTRS